MKYQTMKDSAGKASPARWKLRQDAGSPLKGLCLQAATPRNVYRFEKEFLMATKIARNETKFFECEVKRLRLRSSGRGYEPFWKVKTIGDALTDGDTEFRCKECHGEVKLHKRHVENGPLPHAEHKLRADSEYCVAGMYFQQATDGRSTRFSSTPVS
jgi:hypothetical protein